MPMIKDGHLGGYVLNGDSRTFYPELWDKLIEDFEIKSMIDLGCGEGHAAKYFYDKNVEVLAIDGSEKVKDSAVFEPILIHDYTKGIGIPPKDYDFCWCCEFVEHVEEEYIQNFVATFKRCKYVAMTHALPKQGGYHHVNEQEAKYWIKIMMQAGFELIDLAKIEEYRILSHDYFRQTGLVFKRKDYEH